MKNLSLTFCLAIAALLASVGSGFASDLPPCPEYRHPTKSPWMNCFGTYTFASGNKYVGGWKDDKKHGLGTYTYPDGENYQGQVWPGWCHFPDFTKASVRDWWTDQLKAYVDLGIEGYWNDMNEIATWGQYLPDNILFDCEGKKATSREDDC